MQENIAAMFALWHEDGPDHGVACCFDPAAVRCQRDFAGNAERVSEFWGIQPLDGALVMLGLVRGQQDAVGPELQALHDKSSRARSATRAAPKPSTAARLASRIRRRAAASERKAAQP